MAKRFLLGIFSTFLFFGSINASHFSAGHLTYRYIGDSTNTPREYLIEMTIYRNIRGISLGTSNLNIEIRPDSGSSFTLPLIYLPPTAANVHPLDPEGRMAPSTFACALSPQEISLYKYQNTVVLPAFAKEFQFKSILPCCRDNSDNLISGGLALTAYLNRNYGDNNLAKPIDGDFLASLCVNQEFTIGSLELDPDIGDRTFLLADSALNGSFGSLSRLPFSGNFSIANPLPTDSAEGGYVINPAKASARFTPTQVGIYTLPFKVINRRFDTVSSAFRTAGSYHFEIRVTVGPACNTSQSNGPKLTSRDTLQNVIIDSCNTQSLYIRSNKPLDYSTVDENGGNFRVFSLVRQINDSIVNVRPINRRLLKLSYKDSITANDTLMIITQMGLDSNKIASGCGFEQQSPDTIYHIIKGCSGVGQKEVQVSAFNFYPNPAGNQFQMEYILGSDISRVEIRNTSGQLLKEQGAPKTIKIENLPNGTYFIQVIAKSGAAKIKKLIKI
jgi:hypothetical protein